MSFQIPDWEKDTLGDQTHDDLFRKKNRKTKIKNKLRESKIVNEKDNKLHSLKTKKVSSQLQSMKNTKQNKTALKIGNKNKQKPNVTKSSTPKKIHTNSLENVDKRLRIRKPTKQVTVQKSYNASPKSVRTIQNVQKEINKNNVKPSQSKITGKANKNTRKLPENTTRSKINKTSRLLTENKATPKIKKKLKRLENKNISTVVKDGSNDTKPKINKTGLNIADLKKQLAKSLEVGQINAVSLRDRMLDKLKAARFRYLNEQIYTSEGKEAMKLFQSDPEAFQAYHQGYRQQVSRWPLNPLDTIIAAVKKLPSNHIIADFGCGDGRLSHSVPQSVHSFDLISTNDDVVACDMARVPLRNGSVDVAVFCLSLMGTNLKDYLAEANRVLKIGGVLKIAEVESRFERVEVFIQGLQKYGFKNTWQDLSHNLFYFLDFIKERDIKYKNKLPTISLHPCLYKKR